MKFILTIYACRLKGSAVKVSKEVVEIDSSQSQGPRRSPRKHDKKRAPSKKMKKPQRRMKIQQKKIVIHHQLVGIIWIYVMKQWLNIKNK